MSIVPSSVAYEEYLNEQLVNCINLQTNVIHSLSQYSQHISLQLFEIKSNVEILTNRVINLHQQQLEQQQQQQQLSYFLPSMQAHLPIPLPDPLLFLRQALQVPSPLNEPFFHDISNSTTEPAPFSFLTTTYQEPSRNAPFVFDSIFSNNTAHLADEVDNEYDTDERDIRIEPIITLLPVEVKTGEEDENILFCERAKLYRFDTLTNEMKERGIGEMKILQHKISKQCRILMRREQIFKICANHRITSQMELKPHQSKENAYIWSAMDYADGKPKHEILCVKFKTDEQAKQFVKIFNQVKTMNQNEIDNISLIKNISLNDDDIIIIGEVQPTKEQIQRAEYLQLPRTFYLYENKEPCKGCRGCKEDLSDEVPFGNQITYYNDDDAATAAAILENLTNFPSGFFPNSSLPALMSMMPTWFPGGVDPLSSLNIPSPPKDNRMIIKAKRSLPSNRIPPPPPSQLSPSNYEQNFSGTNAEDERVTVQTHQKKSRNFSGNNTESYSLNTYATQMVQNILTQAKQELSKQIEIVTTNEDKTMQSQHDNNNNNPSIFANSSTAILANLVPVKPNTNAFSFTDFDKSSTSTPVIGFQFSTTNSSTITTNTSSIFTFGNTPKLSFSDLVKQTSDNKLTTDNTEQRIFPGHGSLIFHKNEDHETDNENDNYEPQITFKPIVKLLPVEVKTGEEDENILFCERAKLSRFDAPTKEWKERGIGEMKILQHKTSKQCRILMRREQIFKICANHRITSQMELEPHQSKENAYIWAAMDYADGKAKQETLFVRFKTDDQAKRFYQQFNDAKQINTNIQQ
ncbi:unnamed protein product [Adineta steineri]|uniref:RanBD1 domain-containing protein n=2 Tax=Adineta steineri TaxID=433720 RepID=A0A814N1V1_9BILA|nr:unnamed protein product [Adineta steineri]CAF3523108.1 unnamed protein product [Adineta steineri]CAF3708381.1 unnamed protein product [Adineta steineri]